MSSHSGEVCYELYLFTCLHCVWVNLAADGEGAVAEPVHPACEEDVVPCGAD